MAAGWRLIVFTLTAISRKFNLNPIQPFNCAHAGDRWKKFAKLHSKDYLVKYYLVESIFSIWKFPYSGLRCVSPAFERQMCSHELPFGTSRLEPLDLTPDWSSNCSKFAYLIRYDRWLAERLHCHHSKCYLAPLDISGDYLPQIWFNNL